jgi:hypothetical protein
MGSRISGESNRIVGTGILKSDMLEAGPSPPCYEPPCYERIGNHDYKAERAKTGKAIG